MSDSNLALANLLFPNLPYTPESLEVLYPPRMAPVVTRVGPSPTGFLHIGTVSTAMLSERIAHLNSGVFYIRNEDTDDKREVANAAEIMVNGLKKFGIEMDEGGIGPDHTDIGAYGPYSQSERGSIYQTYVKELLAQ